MIFFVSKSTESNEEPGLISDLNQDEAERQLQAVLEKYNLTRFVSLARIKDWIANRRADLVDLSFVSMLVGLVERSLEREDVAALVRPLLAIYQHVPQHELGGKSPRERAPANPGGSGQLRLASLALGAREWQDDYERGLRLLKAGEPAKAIDRFNACFEYLLKNKTTFSEVYRLFANAATANFMRGERYSGERLLTIALELNPQYDFAQEAKRKLEQGEFDNAIADGFRQDLIEKMRDKNHPINRWDYEAIREEWSEKKILAQLALGGITVDQEWFRARAAPYHDISEFAKQELYPLYRGAPEDEDFIWMAADTLWQRWCPDFYATLPLWETIEQLEEAVYAKKPARDRVAPLLERLGNYAAHAPKPVWNRWRQSFEFYYSEVLIDCLAELLGGEWEARALSLARQFGERTSYGAFALVEVAQRFKAADTGWREALEGVASQYPYDIFPFLLLAGVAEGKGEDRAAEDLLQRALAVAERREREQIHTIAPVNETIYGAYHRSLERLAEFYETRGDKPKSLEIRQRLERIQEQRAELEWSPRAALAADKAAAAWRKREEKQLAEDPAWRYFQYLQSFQINFATAQPSVSKRVYFSSRGGAVKAGRNDPCPCGSGKKFKRCCGNA